MVIKVDNSTKEEIRNKIKPLKVQVNFSFSDSNDLRSKADFVSISKNAEVPVEIIIKDKLGVNTAAINLYINGK